MKPTNVRRRPQPQVEVSPKAEEIVKEVVEEVKDELKEPIEPNAYVHGVDQFLNIRKEPSTREGTIITMLTNGTKIIVKDKKPVKNEHGEWYKVKVLNPEMDGYAMTKYIVVK